MEPIPFKESNLLLGAGGNENTGDMPCALSINAATTGSTPYAISCWKLTADELAEINRTGVLWLGNMGWPPPPIMCMAYNPFTMHGFTSVDIPNL